MIFNDLQVGSLYYSNGRYWVYYLNGWKDEITPRLYYSLLGVIETERRPFTVPEEEFGGYYELH